MSPRGSLRKILGCFSEHLAATSRSCLTRASSSSRNCTSSSFFIPAQQQQLHPQFSPFASRFFSSLPQEDETSSHDSSFQPALAMSPHSVRTGVIAVKCGMTAAWDKWGVRIPITVLWVDDVQVVQVKPCQDPGFAHLQLGFGRKKAKQLSKPELGHLLKAGVPVKRKLHEFKVTSDAVLPVGTTIGVRHFVPGQFVDITGITIGKGFQGGMKRWGFRGLPASHGTSLAHRSLGSTGGRQDPGKVFKNKKMAGHMGVQQRTVQNIWVYKVEPARNLLWVRGQVPGHAGNFLFVRDALFKKPDPSILPFPTFFAPSDEELESLEPLVANTSEEDPFGAD